MNEPTVTPLGNYRFLDGCLVARPHTITKNFLEMSEPCDPSSVYGSDKWVATWADGTPLRGDNDQTSFFDTLEEAFQALAEGGEGPSRGKESQMSDQPIKPLTVADLAKVVNALVAGGDGELPATCTGCPEFLIGIVPYMQELLNLREENRELRFRKFTAPSWLEIVKAAGWDISQDEHGTWHYSIPMKGYSTGGCGIDSAEETLKKALKRTEEMIFARDDDDDD